MGSPSSIVMLGLGNGTFTGSPSLMITMGYGIGEESTPSYETVYTTGYTWIDVTASGYTWQEVRIER